MDESLIAEAIKVRGNKLKSLREARIDLGLTLEDIYKGTGISIPHISEIERGVRVPTESQLERLEFLYGMKIKFVMIPYIDQMNPQEEIGD
jgi:transcriptional regulator with XRE-family HTH domain